MDRGIYLCGLSMILDISPGFLCIITDIILYMMLRIKFPKVAAILVIRCSDIKDFCVSERFLLVKISSGL